MGQLNNRVSKAVETHPALERDTLAAPALLERERDLAALKDVLEEASAGRGRIAIVCGEAGIGKTSFIDHFVACHGRSMRILKGQCDALYTPSPLGPLHDIARHIDGRVLSQLESGAPRVALFSTVLDQLRDPARPTLLVLEDIHWADEATLDLIKFLSRRIAQTRVLLVLTFRNDEGPAQHPLRMLLGDLATSRATLRIELSRLTVDAVRDLIAGRPLDPEAVHRQTAGNPFFVTEVVSHSGPGIPGSVRDAVLARVGTLGPTGRAVLEAAAVIGGRIELTLLERVAGHEVEGLGLCMKAGLLEPTEDGVAFRHELVRDAVLTDLPPGRFRDLHRQALLGVKASRGGRGNLAQLVHFAVGARDVQAVLEFGPAAARAAAQVGAHRDAAQQYRTTLRFAADRPPSERAELLKAYAEECSLFDELLEAVRTHREAIELFGQAGDRLKQGETLAALAWPLVRSAQNAAAEDASRRAIDALESMPPTRQLAEAYRIQAHLRMLDRDLPGALHWGAKAIDLATQFDDRATIAAAEMVVGSAMLVAGDDSGLQRLDRSLAHASEAGLDALVALSYLNVGSSYAEQYRFADAERQLAKGIAYTADRDLDHANHYMRAWLALTRLYQGRWSEAEDIATAILGRPSLAIITKIMTLVALGRLRVRRGDAGADALLDEALELALQTDTLQRLGPVRAARAEAAWFAGDVARVVANARAVHDLAMNHRHRWHTGEFAYWRWRAGDDSPAPDWSGRPFLLQIEGDWRGAADAWEHLGCSYEQARALADGDVSAKLEALKIFDRLGAAPAAAALRQKLRSEGMRRIPRGPRASTRRSAFGLTRRELQILDCLVSGLSNSAIGTRLHISSKTVDHHVSSVLAKLGAATRKEAAAIAREQRLLAQNGELASAK